MSPHRRPLLDVVHTQAVMAQEYRQNFGHEGKAAATLRANVCHCHAHYHPHQRGIGRCVEPRVLSSEVGP